MTIPITEHINIGEEELLDVNAIPTDDKAIIGMDIKIIKVESKVSM